MKVIRFMAVGVLLALAACSKPAATDKPAERAATPAKPPLVTVNGKPISEQLYEEYVKALARQARRASSRPKTASRSRKTWCASSSSRSRPRRTASPTIRKSPRASSSAGSNVLQQAAAQKYLKERTPTDAEMRAEFEAQIASAPLVEFQARHILVSSEDVAHEDHRSSSRPAMTSPRWPSACRPTRRPRPKAATSAGSRPRDMDPAFTDAVAR